MDSESSENQANQISVVASLYTLLPGGACDIGTLQESSRICYLVL